MSTQIPFDNSYARLPERFFTRQPATPVAAPQLIIFNHALAADLGITPGDEAELAQVFSGNQIAQGAEPLAQAYAGHQFGGFSPQLGDGRAILLGEVVDRDGIRRDIQLKGSGPTPYSRMGDGRAWLGPVLREYVVSEAMHALGVPTTRALAATRTGEPVLREEVLPGAVLTRVAASHIRVGTFQIFAARRDMEALQTLYDYTVARHAPQASDPHDLLQQVIEKQADLIAHWMSLGFIHGVMNTDNCTLSGETIDYGPCAFMDIYDPETVFSSIDRYGRYGYSAQADIIVWNMAQLATALVPLLPDTDAAVTRFTEQVHAMPGLIRKAWLNRFAAKIGIADPQDGDLALITDLLDLMQKSQSDFTNTFRGLADDPDHAHEHFTDTDGFDRWAKGWRDHIKDIEAAQQLMQTVNPVFIPRNHRIEEMIQAAVTGDDSLFHRLMRVLSTPFAHQPDAQDLRRPPQPTEVVGAA